VQLFLAHDGIEADSKDIHGRTPLSFAAEAGSKSVVKLLLAQQDIDVNSRDSDGRTPLSFANELDSDWLVEDRKEVVQLLLAQDDIEVDLNGLTPQAGVECHKILFDGDSV